MSAGEVVALIAGLRRDLDRIWSESTSAHDTLALQRLDRWKDRAVRDLTKHVSREEGERLSMAQFDRMRVRSFSDLENWVTLYQNFLDALAEEVQRDSSIISQQSEQAPISTAGVGPSVPSGPGLPRVFLVHGHDEPNTLRLQALLDDRFGLTPVVMSLQPMRGRTLIEKFEEEAAGCSFAFVLLTPDDQVQTASGEYTQARPNVVFELGWFFARLGRERVVMLLQRGTRIHSDLDGIGRIEFDRNIEEKILEIERELGDAGLI